MSEIWMLKKTGGGILKFLLIICIKTSFLFAWDIRFLVYALLSELIFLFLILGLFCGYLDEILYFCKRN